MENLNEVLNGFDGVEMSENEMKLLELLKRSNEKIVELESSKSGDGRKEEIWSIMKSGKFSIDEICNKVERSKNGEKMNGRNCSCVISYLKKDIETGKLKYFIDGGKKICVGFYKDSKKRFVLEFEDVKEVVVG